MPKPHCSPELLDLAALLTRHDVEFDWDDASDPWMRNRLVEFADALLRLEEQQEKYAVALSKIRGSLTALATGGIGEIEFAEEVQEVLSRV